MSTPAASGKERAGAAARAAHRSAARLAAIQALYQMDMVGTDANRVVAEFTEHRLVEAAGSVGSESTDAAFFSDIVLGVVREQRTIDPALDGYLAEGWRLGRIDSTLRAILRSAAYEIALRNDVPARVVINEYVDIAHSFFDGEEPKVVNGILDHLARARRPDEFGQDDNG